jgi:hypothetical protein
MTRRKRRSTKADNCYRLSFFSADVGHFGETLIDAQQTFSDAEYATEIAFCITH